MNTNDSMDTNEKIAARRQELGLTKQELANQLGLPLKAYHDLELHSDEIYTVTELREAKGISNILKLDFFDLFKLKCAFCDEDISYAEIFSLPRNELIAIKREEMSLSTEELGDQVGFYGAEIEKLENDPAHLETWPIDFIKDLATVIDVPLQILLNIKCKKCGK
jgi:DNA-binding XRE family transcriptional regulator